MSLKTTLISLFILIAAGIQAFSSETASKDKNCEYNLSSDINDRMRNESDDLIDDMPEGYQDKIADAIYHSLRGEGKELMQIREARDKSFMEINGVSYEDINTNGNISAKIRLYEKEKSDKSNKPLMIFLHGGGWTLGGIESGMDFCKSIAASGNVRVMAVDWTDAPEVSPSAMVSECKDAIEYIIKNASTWGCTRGGITLAGEDAGANLILSVIAKLEDNAGLAKISSLVFYYPLLSPNHDFDSQYYKKYGRGYGLDKRLLEAFIDSYNFKNDAGKIRWWNKTDADGWNPNMLIISAGKDIVTGEAEEFVKTIRSNGIDAKTVVYPEALHFFISQKGQPTAFNMAVKMTLDFITAN